ncbi:MAG TPA: glutamate-5-semialdehyde dehydrogenase [Candidatus Atribacteria bacterium]|nr:glutamate-5-semialdehyde dehydrogenase [Candidatus Atribacteria bacterium]
MEKNLKDVARKTKEASYFLANISSFHKDQFLLQLADNLERDEEEIKEENRKDLERAKDMGMKPSLLDRLELSSSRIKAMASGLREVANFPDPVGEVIEGSKRPNGLLITKMRVPLGVLAIIYEARPNVTIDSVGLGIKSGNALLLRGSNSAIHSNQVLVGKTKETLSQCGFPPDVVNLLECKSHEEVQELLTLRDYIDVIIPRGGADLIKLVVENSQVPVIETGVGNCHVYVDGSADWEMAEKIVINAKTQRPSVCNACETLLVDNKIAPQFLPRMIHALEEREVEIRGCEKTRELVKEVKLATEEDWYAEYLDLILAVKVVGGIEEAIKHINSYGSHHSEAIVTQDYTVARKFLEEVDAAAVYVNASTRFTDGGEFGMGAEIGISNQKLHARGPMGLRELTTVKYMVWGTGQIRE